MLKPEGAKWAACEGENSGAPSLSFILQSFFLLITQISIDIMGEAVAQMDTPSALTELSDGCCCSVTES